jgi:hypothetical protein
MKRIHLFEFEDQKWFPDFLRNYGCENYDEDICRWEHFQLRKTYFCLHSRKEKS